jgi:hypothetical protein
MRTKTITLYKFSELSEDAQRRAIERYRDRNYEIHWQEELIDSFSAVYAAMNVKLKDYSLGLHSYSYVKIDLEDSIANLSGARALGWIENNLLAGLRMTRHEYMKNRKNNFQYGYRIGKIKECPFTGTCFDMDFLDCITKELKSGDTLGEVLKRRLPEKYVELLQAEYDDQNSDEYISDTLIANEYEFTAAGDLA